MRCWLGAYAKRAYGPSVQKRRRSAPICIRSAPTSICTSILHAYAGPTGVPDWPA